MPKYILILFLLSIISCKKETDLSENQSINLKDSVDFSQYSVSFNKLSQKDKKNYKNEIINFYNKNINIDNPSSGFLVAKNGEIIYEDYQGFANYDKKTPLTSTTPLHLASVSKVLTATVILRMIDAKQLSLDTTLQSLLPQFPFTKVTIQMLLNHRTGIPNYAYFCEKDNNWDTSKTLHNQDVLDILAKGKIDLEFIPNTKFSYCNTNYALLALVIEHISKLSYPEAMQELLFKPLQMTNTFVAVLEKDKDDISQSYKSTWKKVPFDYLDAIYGDKNIYATPQDLLKFDKATYSDVFLSKEIKELAYKGYSYERRGIKNYGLGIRLREWDDGTILHYHNGWWHGNTSAFISLKKDTVCIIALSNKFTRKVYQSKRLSAIFGNYPFELDEGE